MTEFITRGCHAEHRYEVIIKTDSEEHYCAAQAYARLLIGHQKPMTNGDRYRAMSDREMAALIYNGISSDPCDYCENSGYCDGAPCKGKASEEIIEDWLKQPAEEET